MILEESKPQNSQVKMSAATTEAMELAATALKSLSTKSLRKLPYVEESSNHPHSNFQTLWMKAIDLTHLLKKKKRKTRPEWVADSPRQGQGPRLHDSVHTLQKVLTTQLENSFPILLMSMKICLWVGKFPPFSNFLLSSSVLIWNCFFDFKQNFEPCSLNFLVGDVAPHKS
jgi:hypothetical protein